MGPSTTVVVSFRTVWGNEPFVSTDLFDYPSQGVITFKDLSLFLTDISLITANGVDEVDLDDIAFLDVSSIQVNTSNAEKGWVKAYFSVPLGDYTGLKFGLGVGVEENRQKPSDFAAENPLGVHNRYSDEFGSYIFENITGQYHYDGNTTNFEINILEDEMFKQVKLSKPFSIAASGENIDVVLDLEQVFQRNDSILDLSANPMILSPVSPYMGWLSNNLQQSFSF